MTIPAVLFGIFLSTLYGALFHFWRGGDTKRLILYIALSWVGFWLGHFIGQLNGLVIRRGWTAQSGHGHTGRDPLPGGGILVEPGGSGQEESKIKKLPREREFLLDD